MRHSAVRRVLGGKSGAATARHVVRKLPHGLFRENVPLTKGEGGFGPIDSRQDFHPSAFLVGRQMNFHSANDIAAWNRVSRIRAPPWMAGFRFGLPFGAFIDMRASLAIFLG